MLKNISLLFVAIVLLQPILVSGQKEDKIKLDKGFYAEIETTKGTILLELYHEDAPLTVANFIGLAEGGFTVFDTIKHKKPFYDGIKFHRVIANFMIQAGDPTGKGSGGPGYRFYDETDNGIPHSGPGILSMANAGPNTNGSQFFITHVATPHLNGKHTVFGKVLQGQDVVDAIQQGDEMTQVKIKRKGFRNRFFYNPSKVFKAAYEERENNLRKIQEHNAKLEAQNKVRMIEAQARSAEEYKTYFLDLIREEHPEAEQTETGLVYVIKEEGTGELPKKGSDVSLHYTGVFVFGNKFDSSKDRGTPFNIKYQETGLIAGFTEGVGLANKGTKITLFIPYYLAYGEQGRMPNIPPYADLIFELEILEVK